MGYGQCRPGDARPLHERDAARKRKSTRTGVCRCRISFKACWWPWNFQRKSPDGISFPKSSGRADPVCLAREFGKGLVSAR